jgi:hypothetical protein
MITYREIAMDVFINWLEKVLFPANGECRLFYVRAYGFLVSHNKSYLNL